MKYDINSIHIMSNEKRKKIDFFIIIESVYLLNGQCKLRMDGAILNILLCKKFIKTKEM